MAHADVETFQKPNEHPGKTCVSFNYNLVKKKYMSKLKKYLNYQSDEIWSEERIQHIIQDIKEGKERLKHNISLTEMQSILMQKFDVIKLYHAHDALILKRTPENYDKPRLVLSREQFLDAMVNVHKQTNHGNRIAMIQFMKDKYMVLEDCIDLFLSCCNVCAATVIFNFQVFVEIIPMLDKTYNEFNSVLFYKDTTTDYILLKPLSNPHDTEIAMELIKIFTDFGPPKEIVTVHEFFPDIVKSLEQYRFRTEVLIVKSSGNTGVIQKSINDWMEKNKSENWPIGCHMVQHEHNNTISATQTTPYKCVFQCQPSSSKEKKTKDSKEARQSVYFDKNLNILIRPLNTFQNNENFQETNTIDLDYDSACMDYLALIKKQGVDGPLTIQNCFEDSSDEMNEEDIKPEVCLEIRKKCSRNDRCPECHSKLLNGYMCHKCQFLVHSFCSNPVKLNTNRELLVICNSCKVNETKAITIDDSD